MDEKESKGTTLLANVVDTLLDDAGVRSRQRPSVMIEGLATLPRLKSSSTAPATSQELTAEQLELALTLKPNPKSSHGPISPSRKIEKPNKGSTKAAKRQLKKLHEDITIETYGKPKISSENWIPEVIRFKSIQRDFAVTKENLAASLVLEGESQKELKRLSQSELQRALTEESLGSKRKVHCACCQFLFSYVNLTLKVSMKAITDIRKKWMNGKPNGYADPDGSKIGNVPRCYNEVAVCRFCAQFFRDQDNYRPSFDKIAYEERKAAYFEQRRLEKEYWDPLKMCAKDEEKRKLMNEERETSANFDQNSFGSGDERSWESESEGTYNN